MRKLPTITEQIQSVKILSKITKRHTWYGGFLFFANLIIALFIIFGKGFSGGGDVNQQGVALIDASSGTGTGFLIKGQEGLMLTAAHVVKSDPAVAVIFRDGTFIEANVLFTDASMDVALLKLNELMNADAALPIGDSEIISETDEVYVIGYPGGNYSITKGIISEKKTEYLKTDASSNPGNSGGPLVSKNDNMVIGMVVGTGIISGTRAEGQHYAVPINKINELCSAKGYSLK